MSFGDLKDSSSSAQDDQGGTSAASDAPHRDAPPGEARPSVAHVVFDPFTQTRRRSSREARVFTPYGA